MLQIGYLERAENQTALIEKGRTSSPGKSLHRESKGACEGGIAHKITATGGLDPNGPRTPVLCVILIPLLMPYRSGEIGASCHAQRENCFIGIALR